MRQAAVPALDYSGNRPYSDTAILVNAICAKRFHRHNKSGQPALWRDHYRAGTCEAVEEVRSAFERVRLPPTATTFSLLE